MVIKSHWGSILAVGLAVLAIGLGIWQLGRAHEKQALLDLRTSRAAVIEPGRLTLFSSARSARDLDQHKMSITGVWLFDKTVFLDNRAWEGRAGAHVITPVMLADQTVIWVNRGWVAKAPGDLRAPVISRPPHPAGLHGVALASVMKRMELSSDAGVLRSGTVWQNFDWASAQRIVSADTWPVIVWQTQDNGDGLLRRLPQVSGDVPKHYGYAIQWFLMSAVALFFAWRLRKKSS